MKDYTLTFSPELRLFAAGDHIAVLFDTLSPMDALRATRIVRLANDFAQLSFALTGFDETSITDIDDHRYVTGAIQLVVVTADGQETTHTLADCQFLLPALGKRRKDGSFEFPAVKPLAGQLRQAISKALTAAVRAYYDELSIACDDRPAFRQTAVPGPFEPRPARGANDDHGGRLKRIAAFVAVPLLIWLTAWGVSSAWRQKSPSVEDAVARAMTQDPQAVASQVELTRQTLREMGLDLGAGGDIGCLTSPPATTPSSAQP